MPSRWNRGHRRRAGPGSKDRDLDRRPADGNGRLQLDGQGRSRSGADAQHDARRRQGAAEVHQRPSAAFQAQRRHKSEPRPKHRRGGKVLEPARWEKPNGFLAFDVRTTVDVGPPPAFEANFTLAAWDKPAAGVTAEREIIADRCGHGDYQFRLSLTADNRLGFVMTNDSGYDFGLGLLTTAERVAENRWTHVAVTAAPTASAFSSMGSRWPRTASDHMADRTIRSRCSSGRACCRRLDAGRYTSAARFAISACTAGRWPLPNPRDCGVNVARGPTQAVEVWRI